MSKESSSHSTVKFVRRYAVSLLCLAVVSALLYLLVSWLNGPLLLLVYPLFYWPVWFCACAFFAFSPKVIENSALAVMLSVVFVLLGLFLSYILKIGSLSQELFVLLLAATSIALPGFLLAEFSVSRFTQQKP